MSRRVYILGLLVAALLSVSAVIYLDMRYSEIKERCSSVTASTLTTTVTSTQTSTHLVDLCSIERLIDFSKLKPINTTLSKEDLLQIYTLVLNEPCFEMNFVGLKSFLNPLAPPIHPQTRREKFTDTSYGALPEELTSRLKCDYRFALFETIYDGNQTLCKRQFVTVTTPRTMDNETVKITYGTYHAVIGSKGWPNEGRRLFSAAGASFYLSKTSDEGWKIINREPAFIAHSP